MGFELHAKHDGEQGWPEAVAEAVLVTVVPVVLHPVTVE